jgi:hypothetical protein
VQTDHRDAAARLLVEDAVFATVIVDGDVGRLDRALARQGRGDAPIMFRLEAEQDALEEGRVLRPLHLVARDDGLAELRVDRLRRVVERARVGLGERWFLRVDITSLSVSLTPPLCPYSQSTSSCRSCGLRGDGCVAIAARGGALEDDKQRDQGERRDVRNTW